MQRVRGIVDELLARSLSIGELVALHARLKLLLMAHSPAAAHGLGHLVGTARSRDRAALADAYRQGVRAALATPPSVGRHTNALEHMAGYFRARADAGERHALHACIDEFRRGLVPLGAPLALVRAQAARHGVTYLAQQLYLEAA